MLLKRQHFRYVRSAEHLPFYQHCPWSEQRINIEFLRILSFKNRDIRQIYLLFLEERTYFIPKYNANRHWRRETCLMNTHTHSDKVDRFFSEMIIAEEHILEHHIDSNSIFSLQDSRYRHHRDVHHTETNWNHSHLMKMLDICHSLVDYL